MEMDGGVENDENTIVEEEDEEEDETRSSNYPMDKSISNILPSDPPGERVLRDMSSECAKLSYKATKQEEDDAANGAACSSIAVGNGTGSAIAKGSSIF